MGGDSAQKKIRGGEEKRVEGGIEEKSVGALCTEKMTRGGCHGRGSEGQRRGDSLSFIQIFWEHVLSAACCFI